MRLLNYESNGKLCCTEYVGDVIPRYAILSHVWGFDADEVTFDDLMEGSGESKQGYEKTKFFTSQAMRDGLHCFRVDTCCIDKSSSSELSEAINSIFRWFASAARCYVYLADVSSSEGSESPDNPFGWISTFQKSRWFTRGWTLQELLAPQFVEFFSREGERLGDKISMQETIHGITGIPTDTLNNSKPLGEYSVAEKMSWAASRYTPRIEDRAYCLMGLFGISMPLLYGEGDLAFQRFQKEIMGLTDQISGLRLLNIETNPLVIETFALQDQPPYAIFSHTWGAEEVSYQDILLGKGPGKKDTKESGIAVNRQHVLASSTCGSILAVSTKRAVLNFKRQSAQCTRGTRTHRSALCIWRITNYHRLQQYSRLRAGGSREAGIYVCA
jgi:hypothetical protein